MKYEMILKRLGSLSPSLYCALFNTSSVHLIRTKEGDRSLPKVGGQGDYQQMFSPMDLIPVDRARYCTTEQVLLVKRT